MNAQCIVLTTRPLVMWLLLHSIPPSATAPNQLAAPIAALVHTSAESAMTITSSLSALAEHDQLQAFLPFELEYAFAAAMLLCILNALLPDYVPDHTWSRKSRFVLDTMIKKRNLVAQLRKSELDQLEALLTPFRRDPTAEATAAGEDHSSQQMEQYVTGQFGVNTVGDVFNAPLASITLESDLLSHDPTLAWDALAGSSNQMLSLAEQFEMGDLDVPFFFEPV
jgi:proline utilization trans-activator